MTTLTAFLASVPYTMRRKEGEPKRERYFQYTFYLVLRLLGTYSVGVEVAQSQGRVDCVLKTQADSRRRRGPSASGKRRRRDC